MSTNKLLPVRVPWMVSPSTSFLELLARASSDAGAAVSLVGYFALRDEATTQVPGQGLVEESATSGPYQRVLIAFSHAAWSRMSSRPQHDSHFAGFDRTAIPLQWTPELSVNKWGHDVRREWRRTGLCPDPQMYEVEGSCLLESVCGRNAAEYKHVHIVGHDVLVDVIATAWSWKELPPTSDEERVFRVG